MSSLCLFALPDSTITLTVDASVEIRNEDADCCFCLIIHQIDEHIGRHLPYYPIASSYIPASMISVRCTSNVLLLKESEQSTISSRDFCFAPHRS